jgi:hypothetical protein
MSGIFFISLVVSPQFIHLVFATPFTGLIENIFTLPPHTIHLIICLPYLYISTFSHFRMDVEKAYELFIGSWDIIKQGNLFDDETNTTFDYMIKSLWNTPFKSVIKSDIIKHLPSIFAYSHLTENPPPVFYILVSLKDADIIKEFQSLLLVNWIKKNSDENSTYQLINFIDTFIDKNIPIDNFLKTIIRKTSLNMQKDMIEALAYLTTTKMPHLLNQWLERLVNLGDKKLLKDYVNMIGRRAVLTLTGIMRPGDVEKLLSGK